MAGSKTRGIDPGAFRALWMEGPMAVRSDADLVRVFADGHREAAEAAFEAIVARHGPMVLGLCRRIVRDEHAAEDAFQATFLILARKAPSVEVDDSLGRWLHGVARRVAVRASRAASKEAGGAMTRTLGPADPAVAAIRAEARGLIAEEVGRLPRRFREVVTLCHLDGLSHDNAAEALGVPVGTIRSRLSRAREFLRSRLAKRGLAPLMLVAWLGERRAAADVPKSLLELTLRNAAGAATVAAPASILALADRTLRSYAMAKAMGAGALMAALGCLTAGAYVLARGDDEPPKAPATTAKPSEPKPAPGPSLEDQYRRILKEFAAAKEEFGRIADAAKSDFERWKLWRDRAPDEADYARRIVDLAEKHPKEIASRDALIWILYQPHRADVNAYGDEFARAVRLLVFHHADDPEVARVGLGFKHVLSRHRDDFLESIYACAEKRETKGLIRLALADYLTVKSRAVVGARKETGRTVIRSHTYDEKGNLGEQTFPMSNEDEGYRVQMRMLDPEYVRGESERLFEEVISEYADVPYITTGLRDMERKARETPSSSITDPEKKRAMVETERYLAEYKRRTLGEVASARLDDLRNLAVGKVAPEFEGTGADGKPIKLADHRGKVVVLAYWFSTCGPCLREIPHERELAAEMKGRPFTLVGIVTDGRADDARRVIESEGMTWPNVVTGGDKVAERYHISGNPAYYVLDAGGVIRSKGNLLPSQLDGLVRRLVAETEASARKPTP